MVEENKNNPRITIIEAAKRMKIDPQVLRIGLQRNKFPFGWAIQSTKKGNYSYYISKKLFEEYIGG